MGKKCDGGDKAFAFKSGFCQIVGGNPTPNLENGHYK